MLFLLATLSVGVLGTPVVDLEDALALTEQGRGDIESILKENDAKTLSSKSSKLSKDETQTLMSTDTSYIDSSLTVSNDRRWSMNLHFPELQDIGTCSNGDYAIVTAAAVSAARKIHLDSSLEPLSAQQILECSTAKSGNNACLGGSVVTALEYVSDNILCPSNAYSWTGSYSNQYECDTHQSSCVEDAPRTLCGEKNSSICGFLEVGQGTGQDAFNPDPSGVGEDALKLAVYHQPVIGILQLKDAASLEAFKDFKREDQALSSNLCGAGGESSHVPVLITGYDTSQWILHPAYGSGFGDAGAVYLSRDGSTDVETYSSCFKAAYVPCISQNCLS